MTDKLHHQQLADDLAQQADKIGATDNALYKSRARQIRTIAQQLQSEADKGEVGEHAAESGGRV
jgi:hypothetical protein